MDIKWLIGLLLLGLSLAGTAATSVTVANTEQLVAALRQANQSTDGFEILLQDGEYTDLPRLIIRQDNIRIRSLNGERSRVILRGKGMQPRSDVEIMFDVAADHFYLSGVTLTDVANHLIQVRAEADADDFTLSNCVLQNAYEQLLKVSHKAGGPFAERGQITNCVFQYTKGIGPNYYIGGIDAHYANEWRIENNRFFGIASPAEQVAEHAIHFWNHSKNNSVVNNLIINSDRGIGFGMGDEANQNQGGLIAGNIIIHTETSHPFADAGIVLESSPDTKVIGNTLFMVTGYPNAIEYRFSRTRGVLIQGNVANRSITARNGASATVSDNDSAGSLMGLSRTLLRALENH